MSSSMRFLFAAFFLSAKILFAHGDHSVPGTQPPAPHGGFIAEAEHGHDSPAKGGHDHEKVGHGHEKEGHDHKEEAGHDHKEEPGHDHKEAKPSHEHDHEHGVAKEGKAGSEPEAHSHAAGEAHAEEESEPALFFEAVYKDKLLSVYPLLVLPTNKVTFTAISPKKDLSGISIRIEFPRAKRFEDVAFEVKDDVITAKFDSKKVNRFIVHVSAVQGGEKKVTKVQVEED